MEEVISRKGVREYLRRAVLVSVVRTKQMFSGRDTCGTPRIGVSSVRLPNSPTEDGITEYHMRAWLEP